jgi:ElaB/YqjD/DUF883 family membrane-anchored ribosome-binding protein
VNQTVHDTTKNLTDSAKDKAQEVGSQAADKAKGQVDARTTDAGEQLQSKADNLHAVGDQMRERGDDTFAQVADRVAGFTEDVARYLRDADADRLLGDVEAYARRQPWAVAAGGLLLGFAASRVVRAGSERRSALASDGYGNGYGTGYGNGYGTAAYGTREPVYGTGTGYTTGAGGAGYESLEDRGEIDLTRGYGVTGTTGTTTGSVAPEPPGYDSPSADPVPEHRPLPDTDPAPLGDPEPEDRWGSGGTGGTHVNR